VIPCIYIGIDLKELPMRARAFLLVLSLAFATGCRLNGPVIGHGPDIRPTREPALAAEVTLEVWAKRAPNTLIARDGSNCLVAPDVYDNTPVGSMFRCRWVRG
jgi:hypothetical protein